MAVVVSQSQNELKMLDDQGLDIRPHLIGTPHDHPG